VCCARGGGGGGGGGGEGSYTAVTDERLKFHIRVQKSLVVKIKASMKKHRKMPLKKNHL